MLITPGIRTSAVARPGAGAAPSVVSVGRIGAHTIPATRARSCGIASSVDLFLHNHRHIIRGQNRRIIGRERLKLVRTRHQRNIKTSFTATRKAICIDEIINLQLQHLSRAHAAPSLSAVTHLTEGDFHCKHRGHFSSIRWSQNNYRIIGEGLGGNQGA